MNKEIKRRWVAALREPGRKQTRNYLETRDGQCCLGVLCEIAARDGVITKTYDASKTCHYDDKTSTLSNTVIRWAELLNSLGAAVMHRGSCMALSQLNDARIPFTVIADLIEEQL